MDEKWSVILITLHLLYYKIAETFEKNDLNTTAAAR